MRTGRIITRAIAVIAFLAGGLAAAILLLGPAGIGRSGVIGGHVRGFRLILGSNFSRIRFDFNVVGLLALLLIGIGVLASPMRQNVTAGVVVAVTFVAAGVLIYALLGLSTVAVKQPIGAIAPGSVRASELYHNGWPIRTSALLLFFSGGLSSLRVFFRD